MDDKECIENLMGVLGRTETIAYNLIDIALNFGATKETILHDTGMDFEEWERITNGDFGDMEN